MRVATVATWCVVAVLSLRGLAEVLAQGDGAQDDGGVVLPGPTDIPAPAPAPTLLTFEQVMGYQKRWNDKQEEYLKQGGWRMDEANPGQFYLWHIEHKGIRYALGREDAIYVQARIERDRNEEALLRSAEQATGVQ